MTLSRLYPELANGQKMEPKDYTITALPALTDNYIWIISNNKDAIVIDPTIAKPVSQYLQQHNLKLKAILLTHPHGDHIGGVAELVNLFQPQVVDNFKGQLSDDMLVSIDGFPGFRIITTPGHMYEHVCYLLDSTHLFCGDTLFSLGCGRVFTGDFQAMYNSLNKIKALVNSNSGLSNLNTNANDLQLKKTILCYPAHEYTMRNYEFTVAIDDGNNKYYEPLSANINSRLLTTGISLPVNLEDELNYNLFLRTDDPRIWPIVGAKAGVQVEDAFSCFYHLRQLRNNF